jgi:uncharacterized cupredoxin-like copper-binding protein
MLRLRLALPFFVILLVGAAVPAALEASLSTSTATIVVTAGLPHELSFKVAPKKITVSPAVFKVTNKGKLPHSFKVCTKPTTSSTANSCTGVATKMLAPGATATLTVKLSKNGEYEYLSGTPSQAASGMKGLVTVSLAATTGGTTTPVATTTTTTTTPATTTTTPSSGGSKGGGSVVNGQAVDPACPAGTLVPVGPGQGDQDDDNEGGFPTDGDGCL